MCGSHKTLNVAGILIISTPVIQLSPAARSPRGGATHPAARRPLVDVVGKATLWARTLGAISLQLSVHTRKGHSFWPPSPASMPACTHWPFAAPRRLWQRLLSDPSRPRLSPHVLSHTCRHIRLRLDPPPTRLPAPRRAPLRPSWRGAGRHPLAQSRERGSSGRGSVCRGASSGASGRRRAASAPS